MTDPEDSSANLSLPPKLEDEAISLPAFESDSAGKMPSMPRGAFSPTFAPGDLLANRFRILTFINRGGMGEVYEAEDLELHETIALKTVLPAIARDERALALLKQEVQLSRKVTHQNVCRIFDLACHRSASQDVAPVWFVTMELLKGHTLTQEIQKSGKIPTDRALSLAVQMAEGLDAARRSRIVHGDFKSGNVMLVPAPDGSVRAVITDFGLARTAEAASASHEASVGTPAYMAPEQVKGEPLSFRTDVYSFGVVLYEMVTGQWPFNADTPKKIAEKRLTEAPTPPIRFVPKLEPIWNRVILKCLEREPANRYETASEAMDEITGRSRYRAAWISAAVLGLLLAVGSVAIARARELGPFSPKPVVAVLGWRDRSGDPATQWIGTELSERLNTALEASTTDSVVPTDDIERAKIEFSVPIGRDLEREDLSNFRTALGANSFVLGTYSVQNNRITVDGALQNAKGQAITRFQEEAPVNDLTGLIHKVAADVTAKLDSKEVNEQELDNTANIYPKDAEARRTYFEGLERLRAFDAAGAKAKLQQVVATEDGSVAAHAALAEAWFALRFDREATSEGRKAAELARAQNLTPELLQATEARYAELQQKWSDAAARYRSLHDFFPKQLSYSLSYANALVKSGHPADSLQFLDDLARSPAPIGDDPRIQVLRAGAFASESKFAEQVKAAQQSLVYAGRRREKLLQANAQLAICEAQKNTGQYADALQACDAARSIFSTFDDTVHAAIALNGEANIRIEQSDYKDARDAYRQVVEINTRANAEMDLAGALLNLAGAEIPLGENALAEQHLRQSIDLAQRVEDHGDEGRARISLGSILSDAGKKDEAAQQYAAALKIGVETGDADVQAFAWSALGQIAQDKRDLAPAEEDFRKALALRVDMGEPAKIARSQLRLAAVLLARRNYVAARDLSDKARATADRLGNTGMVADALCALAEIDLATNDFAAGLEKSVRAIAIYKGQQDADSEAEAHLLSARILLRQHAVESAKSEVAKAKALSGITSTTQADIVAIELAINSTRQE